MYDRTKVRNTCYVTIRHANMSDISLRKHFLEETQTKPPFLSLTLKERKGRIVWASFDRRKFSFLSINGSFLCSALFMIFHSFLIMCEFTLGFQFLPDWPTWLLNLAQPAWGWSHGLMGRDLGQGIDFFELPHVSWGMG